jgi:hypothetical protein
MVRTNSLQTPEGCWCRFTASVKTRRLIEEYIKTDAMLNNILGKGSASTAVASREGQRSVFNALLIVHD